MINQSKRILLCGSALLAALPTSAFAQEAQSASDNQGADIIVTAQRRDESLAKTPVAVQIVGTEALDRAQVRTQDDLRFVAPGLTIRAGIDSNEINFAVRGQSKDPLSDTAPGAVPYFNEVPIPFSRGAAIFYDLQSVQVFKGPQGTLFGRTATGGAVLTTTQKPKNEFGGYVGGSLGDFNLRLIEGAINVPLVEDKVLLRVAGIYRERNGFQRNIFPGLQGRVGDSEKYGIRPSLTLNLGSFRNETVVDYFKSKGSPLNPIISGLVPFTGRGAPFIPAEFLYAGVATPTARATGIATLNAFLGGAVPLPVVAGFYDAYFARPGHNPGGLRQELIDQQARGPFVINSDGPLVSRAKRLTVTNISTLELGANTTLKNIFGYVDVDTFVASNSDGTGFGLGNHIIGATFTGGPGAFSGGVNNGYREYSEELQLQGTAFGDRLNYTTGLYYSDELVTFLNRQPFFDILFGGARQTNSYTFNDKSYAIYGQGTYKLNDNGLSVTAGLRYTIDEREKHVLPNDSFRLASPAAPPPGFDYDQAVKYKRLSWQFGIQDQISPTTLLYAVTRRAYKAGGFNGTVAPRVGSAAIAGDSYIDEKVSDVEAGVKFQGRIGTVPARLSIAGFHYWIDNAQRLAFTLANGNPSSLTVNVPKGKTYGLELEGQVSPASWLSLGAVYNYVNASYAPIPLVANGDRQLFNQVTDTPRHSGSIYADLTVPVSGGVSALLHGDVYSQSKTFVSPRSAANEGAVIGNYAIANFRVGVQNREAGWSLIANLKNAFDKTYYTGGLATGEIFQLQILIPAEPRTFSIDARFKF